MSLFSRLARLMHRLERVFAKLHNKWWRYKNRDREVEVEFHKVRHSDEWRAVQAHKPNHLRKSDMDDLEYESMTLSEALNKHDASICGHCFHKAEIEFYTL